ncbi:MAG TPA: alkaline phosphatase D family protein [Burkholderiales bacterium]|nr:alkaline phosphatase D family protein [Burkholderiales bacterium]
MLPPKLIVLGHCTSTTARILCCAAGARLARLAWRAGDARGTVDVELAPAPPYTLGVFDLRELPAGAEITYGVAVGDAVAALPAAERILESPTRRFRLLPIERPVRVALLSCNGIYEYKDAARRFDMWRRLRRELETGSVDLIVHAGDQVYADQVVKRYARTARTTREPDALLATLAMEYRRLYVERFWTEPYVAAVLTCCPNIMTWDDHDIDEGWGSNPNDDRPWRRLFFRAAQQAFSEFQASLGPPRIDEASFACGFTHGDVAFLLLDGRSHRLYSAGRVLGAEQLEAARKWLHALPAATRRVYLVLGIPPVHAKLATAAAILRWTPFSEPYASDLRDGWMSKRNRAECEKLMQLLVDFCRSHPRTDIAILSGDVHVGNIGQLHHFQTGVMWQVTSSGIGSPPPEGLSGWLMEKVSRPAIDLGAGVRGKLMRITEHGHDLMHRRNFALLEPGAAGALRVRLVGEGLAEPREFLLASRGSR